MTGLDQPKPAQAKWRNETAVNCLGDPTLATLRSPNNKTLRHRPKFSRAFGVAVALSILFLLIYSACNWITAQRPHVGSLYFDWERSIPFVSFLILPYLSIDLFFVAAPFLCSTTAELRVFARRIVAATLIAGACFLAFPLRFAFARPPASGPTGVLFDWFRQMDAPYNLVPSLHAAYWVLLVVVYWRHTGGMVRLTIMLWFAAIAVSPVLTYQHHIVDILTGLMLGGLCLVFFPQRFSSPANRPQPHNAAATRTCHEL
jgi:membrane-associated phospholipid phosphatase